MSDIAPISRPAAAGYTTPGSNGRLSHADAGPSRRPSDRVELSQSAQLLSKLNELPDVRQDLIDRVRGEIQAGTYETPDKIDGAIDGLIEDLDV